MNWIDEGIFLNARNYGESASFVTILTRAHA
ncbi:MAG TPA: DNA repair protein RecO, partial [Alphaproteobacteria bacterium]|nr:DNA repair protein RecO [Alphaproteobacteria bacterium]